MLDMQIDLPNKNTDIGAHEIVAKPLTHQVAAHIRNLIIHDILKPGERIREQLIAEQLGISRTPIREALQTVATQRLVHILPNRGAVVVQPSSDEIREMLNVYGTLEGLAAELAVVKATDKDIASMLKQRELMEVAFVSGDRAAYFKANQAFHLALIASSGNATLVEIHGHLNVRLYRIRYLAVMHTEDWRDASKEHEAILNALVQRDGSRLKDLLRIHLNFAWRLVAS